MQCQKPQSVTSDYGRHSACPGLRLLVLIALLSLGVPPWVSAADGLDNRLALVIGNATYAESPLKNPLNDAADMAGVLEDLGFDVILRTDANRREMGKAIREFGRRLKKSRGVGLFYYAGHGMQLENRNYLIPVDTPMYDEDEVPYESIDVGSVLAKMQSAGNALNLLILDACRNNPFPTQFRSSNRGLARVEAPVGSLVVYATAPGKVASDGSGRNGIFTGHLLRYLQKSGLSLTQTIRKTRAAVVEETAGRQVPWESSSLLKEYYLKPAAQPTADTQANEQKVQANLDALFWQSAQAGNTVAEYQAYLKRFPDGMFTELAAARLDQLQSVSIASTGDDKPLIVAAVNPDNTTTADDNDEQPLRTKALNLADTSDRTRPENKSEEIAATADEPEPEIATLVENL
ncbi:MAG: caspase family protein, partial [Gammaproteobacteria bacterium]|nr:caspase family protein [Gammaproteobacteria bacterium]